MRPLPIKGLGLAAIIRDTSGQGPDPAAKAGQEPPDALKESFRKQIRPPFELNGDILSQPLKSHEIPTLDLESLRFSAFGELLNKTHYQNLVRIAQRNVDTTCTLWTKRTDIIEKYKVELPNLIHIYSSPVLNKIALDEITLYDKVFTVFNQEAVDNGVNINCSKSCHTCQLCYTHNNTQFIHEKLR